MNRDIARVARRNADQQSQRIEKAGGNGKAILTVTVATPGGAGDGNYLVKVLWRGIDARAAGYASSYTPAVGHRVMCTFVDHQLFVEYRIVGQP